MARSIDRRKQFSSGGGRGLGGGCHRIKALSFFSQICVNVESSEACEPIRPTLRFMVHDIGQIYAKPHARLKGDHTFSPGRLHCCGCLAFVIPLLCISFFFFFFSSSSAGRLHNALLMVFTPLTLFPGLQRLPSLI